MAVRTARGIRSVSYRCAARARTVQQTASYSWGENVAGQRVVVSFDGGRLRVRRNKRGKRTRKGRHRFHTDWHEPKLLNIYVVGPDGRPSRSWAPIIDGTLRGPDAVFALALSYAKQLALSSADKVLFIADGAPWPAAANGLGVHRSNLHHRASRLGLKS